MEQKNLEYVGRDKKGNKLLIESITGRREYSEEVKNDRLYLISLLGSDTYAFSFDDALKMIELVVTNKSIEGVKIDYINKVYHLLDKLAR